MKSHLNLRNYFAVLACLTVLGTVWSSPVFADCELAKLLASDGAAGDGFGSHVSISGDTAVISASGDDPNGSAYIFRFDSSSWVEEAKLLASDGADGDHFGVRVYISGDTAVVGANSDDDNGANSGSAYIFRYNGSSWVEETKLLASDGNTGEYFGTAIGISDDIAIVGAPRDNDNGSNSGSAYIFRFDGSSWVEETKLLASDGAAEDGFGRKVSISGDTAVIGARYNDDNGDDCGSAYIFRFIGSSWVEEDKLLASDGAEDDFFGDSVEIWGDTAIIGAPGDNDNGPASGSAYIFRFNGSSWAEEDKLLASDGTAGDFFGKEVSILGNTAVIGASDDFAYGSAYIFRFNGSSWVEQSKLLASDGAHDDNFGYDVSISGNTIIIGAGGNDDNGSNSGSAYIFGLSLNPGDLDFDNDVDFVDYSLFAIHWLESDCGPCQCDRADFTRDGVVDYYDLKELCDNWLAGK